MVNQLRRAAGGLLLATTVALLLAVPAYAPPKKPAVVTGAATNVAQTTATLGGTVNPKGSATTYHFDYGLTTSYGQVTPTASAGSGNQPVSVSADLVGLTAGTLYHYRISATNTGGTSNGADATFTTQPAGGGCVPGTPVTITGTGTFAGCYRSTDPAVPAVSLQTSAPVTFDHARIEHTGKGIEDTVTGTQVTVLDTTLQQLTLGVVVNHRAIELDQPASFTAEHNLLIDGDGIWLGGPTNGSIHVSFNEAHDIGRYPHPTVGNCCVQFLQLDHVVSLDIVVAWNKITNTPGQSDAEDVINFYFSGGTDNVHRSNVHHNLTDGSYDRSLSGDDTGTGINIGDAGDAHNYAHDNVAVSTTNAGIGAHETDNYADNNLIVSDGDPQADPNGQAVIIFFNVSPPGLHTTGNRYNFHRFLGDPNQWPCYMSQYCGNGTEVALTEQQARDEWEATRVTAGVTVGPRP